jgi:hypothetical protein
MAEVIIQIKRNNTEYQGRNFKHKTRVGHILARKKQEYRKQMLQLNHKIHEEKRTHTLKNAI